MAAPIRIVIPGAAPVRDTRHQCPCCGASLPGTQYMCAADERRIPQRIRDGMESAVKRDDRAAWTALRAEGVATVIEKRARRAA
jgi:hypothetical protein